MSAGDQIFAVESQMESLLADRKRLEFLLSGDGVTVHRGVREDFIGFFYPTPRQAIDEAMKWKHADV